jgi:pSer/pThr/pTyr-binding forkhead associated (FHA) protein
MADGRLHRLQVGINSLGRYPQNDLVLTPNRVSRRHCVVLVHATGGCEVYDTASRNGTWVNGRRVGRADLRPGDVLALAGQQFLVAWAGPGGEALPPAEWPEPADLEGWPSAGPVGW